MSLLADALGSAVSGIFCIGVIVLAAWWFGRKMESPEWQAQMDKDKAAVAASLEHVRCPTCSAGPPHVRRVRAGERAASGVAGGLLFGRKARAQFQCERCCYLW